MKIQSEGGKNMKANYGTLFWGCSCCGKGCDMVVDDELYKDDLDYYIKARCTKCGKVHSISIGALICFSQRIDWDK